MRLISCLLFIITIIIFFIFQSTKASNLINETCKQSIQDNPTSKYGFCLTSLQAAPASRCATVRGLGSIGIRLVRYNITDARCHIMHLLKEKKHDLYYRACLNDCFQLYSEALDSVKKAMKNYNGKRFNDANIHISAVMTSVTTCEDGFKERKGIVSPLTKRNDDTFQLSAIVLFIMNFIQKG
ncbi:putative invertase inhibitor [Impatiens glandulifera]|uniref:putative invertase inhibitor n=1 Tax=Impatiens glandulifera TaxID=253017 RepID=UPI001FB099BA|nr:putative invertase inhibitor [Impatiens glandulifera]